MQKPTVIIWDIAIMAFAFALPHLGVLGNFLYAPVVLLAIWGYLRLTRQRFSALSFRWKDFGIRPILVGIPCGLVLAAANYWGISPAIIALTGWEIPDFTEVHFVRESNLAFLGVCAFIWLPILYEEIIFRGLFYNRIASWANNVPIALVASSVLIAFYHYPTGPLNTAVNFVVSLGMTLVFIKAGKNLWYSFFTHTAYNTFFITMVKLGYL